MRFFMKSGRSNYEQAHIKSRQSVYWNQQQRNLPDSNWDQINPKETRFKYK
jgi:hypothetical protein